MSRLNIFLLDNLNNKREEIKIPKPKTYKVLLNQIKQKLPNTSFELLIRDKDNKDMIINNEEKYKKIEDVLFIREKKIFFFFLFLKLIMIIYQNQNKIY